MSDPKHPNHSGAPPAATKACPAAAGPGAASAAVTTEAGAQVQKRGPGRPPKKSPAPSLLKQGVVESPFDAKNRLEFVYEDPSVLKSLFAYFKNLKAVDIHLRCTPKGLTFFTRDSASSSRVVAEFPGSRLNHYYCDNSFWLGLNRESVERIFSSVDKSFFKVTLLHRYDNEENLDIIFKDAEIDKECHYQVTVSTREKADEELYAAELLATPQALKAPPIEFQVTSKQFKKSVMDAAHHSDTLTFEKMGQHPLQLTYCRVGIAYHEVYRTPEKIGLRAEVADNSIFRCSVSIGNIKSLAAAMVADHVRVFCREDGDLLLRSEMDALVLSTFTATIRPNER